MGEETETSSTSQDKEKDATCARQRCTEEEEEGISHFLLYFLVHFPRRLDFLCRKPVLLGLLIVSCSGFFFFFFLTCSPKISFNIYFYGSCICNMFLWMMTDVYLKQ